MTAMLFCVLAFAAASPAVDPELAKGIRLVEQGEYEQAVLVLEPAARRLAGAPAHRREAAQADLYLGVAYVGEGSESLSEGAFNDALAAQPDLTLSAFDVSPKVREVFQKVKNEREARASAAAAKKGRSKAPWILLGVAGAGGAAAALSTMNSSGGGEQSATNGPISISVTDPPPPAIPVTGIPTRFTVVGAAAGDASFLWDFGGGDTATGSNVSHIFNVPQTYTVTVRGLASGGPSARLGLTVGSVTGVWDLFSADGQQQTVVIQQSITGQQGPNVVASAGGYEITGTVYGATQATRGMNLLPPAGCSNPGRVGQGALFDGLLNANLTEITGNGAVPCRRDVVQQTLRKRQ